MKHRALVYSHDYEDTWGWWCMDCPGSREADCKTKPSAEKSAYNHTPDPVQVVSGSSRSTLRRAS